MLSTCRRCSPDGAHRSMQARGRSRVVRSHVQARLGARRRNATRSCMRHPPRRTCMLPCRGAKPCSVDQAQDCLLSASRAPCRLPRLSCLSGALPQPTRPPAVCTVLSVQQAQHVRQQHQLDPPVRQLLTERWRWNAAFKSHRRRHEGLLRPRALRLHSDHSAVVYPSRTACRSGARGA